MYSKKIFVLNINDYLPEITKFTYPTIEAYADRIGAELVYITERKYPDYPITFEKHQIYDLADTDWSIYIDSDVLINDEFYDITELSSPNRIILPFNNVATGRYYMDDYFLRDDRFISVTNFISWVPSRCIDYWKPDLERTKEEIIASIYNVPREEFYNPPHRIDDYICSRNIARYGLKVTYIDDIYSKIYGHDKLEYFFHTSVLDHQKIIDIERKNLQWYNPEEYHRLHSDHHHHDDHVH